MSRLRYLTAGESHGPGLTAVLDGCPAGLSVRRPAIDAELGRRQSGYGRGERQSIEQDRVRVLGGVRHGRTTGAPVALFVPNLATRPTGAYVLSVEAPEAGASETEAITIPRPGHADLGGALLYGLGDIRDVIERASARETAAKVACGALAKAILASLGCTVASHVVALGGVCTPAWSLADIGARRGQSGALQRRRGSEAHDRRDPSMRQAQAGETLGQGDRRGASPGGIRSGVGGPTCRATAACSHSSRRQCSLCRRSGAWSSASVSRSRRGAEARCTTRSSTKKLTKPRRAAATNARRAAVTKARGLWAPGAGRLPPPTRDASNQRGRHRGRHHHRRRPIVLRAAMKPISTLRDAAATPSDMGTHAPGRSPGSSAPTSAPSRPWASSSRPSWR